MNIENAPLPNGAAFGPQALPLQDLQPAGMPFERQGDHVMLRGSVSRSSGSLGFPQREVCLQTGARDMEPMTFGPRGVLYSYSTVHVSSSRPTPYTIGYVDFENGVRVLAQVDGSAEALSCDVPVELRADGDRWFVVPVAGTKGAA